MRINSIILEEYKKVLITEGKHWPEDYKKTAINTIKSSPLGKQSWYSDDYISKDVDTFVEEFTPLSHKNSNLGYFMAIIRMFIQYAGTSYQKYQEFIEIKLDKIIGWFKLLVNNSNLEIKYKEKIKNGMTFEEFEKIMSPFEKEDIDKANNTEFTIQDNRYDIDGISSYNELNSKYGGNLTGYQGRSEWCHTNRESTYDTWTDSGERMFVIVYKKNFKDIRPINPDDNNAYDEYGLSLMALLVDVGDMELKNCTLRWNHIKEPGNKIPGRTVDNAFKSFNEISNIVGFDVKQKVESLIKERHKDFKYKEILKKLAASNASHIDIPYGVTEIGREAFNDCTYLQSITIPDSVTKIGRGAFAGCSSLKEINIPNSITSIGDNAFDGCLSLQSITIPDSVTEICYGVFLDCKSLQSITIPNSVTKIGGWVFDNCKSLKSITIPDSVTEIGDGAFWNCVSLQEITIPNSVTKIWGWTFGNCTSLKSITIPDGVTSICANAFNDCTSLQSITIPNSVRRIGRNAFAYCGLKSITIPNSVKSVGDRAFRGCTYLQSITLPKRFDGILQDFSIKDNVKVNFTSSNQSQDEMLMESYVLKLKTPRYSAI